jgi:hypothetical protein
VSESGSIAFHVIAPDGEGRVILLERGGDGSALRVTEWQAGAYHLPGQSGRCSGAEMAARLEAWRRAGWRFSEAPPRIRAWLDD